MERVEISDDEDDGFEYKYAEVDEALLKEVRLLLILYFSADGRAVGLCRNKIDVISRSHRVMKVKMRRIWRACSRSSSATR